MWKWRLWSKKNKKNDEDICKSATIKDRQNFLEVLEIINNNPEYLEFFITFSKEELTTEYIKALITDDINKLREALKTVIDIQNALRGSEFSLAYEQWGRHYYLAKNNEDINLNRCLRFLSNDPKD